MLTVLVAATALLGGTLGYSRFRRSRHRADPADQSAVDTPVKKLYSVLLDYKEDVLPTEVCSAWGEDGSPPVLGAPVAELSLSGKLQQAQVAVQSKRQLSLLVSGEMKEGVSKSTDWSQEVRGPFNFEWPMEMEETEQEQGEEEKEQEEEDQEEQRPSFQQSCMALKAVATLKPEESPSPPPAPDKYDWTIEEEKTTGTSHRWLKEEGRVFDETSLLTGNFYSCSSQQTTRVILRHTTLAFKAKTNPHSTMRPEMGRESFKQLLFHVARSNAGAGAGAQQNIPPLPKGLGSRPILVQLQLQNCGKESAMVDAQQEQLEELMSDGDVRSVAQIIPLRYNFNGYPVRRECEVAYNLVGYVALEREFMDQIEQLAAKVAGSLPDTEKALKVLGLAPRNASPKEFAETYPDLEKFVVVPEGSKAKYSEAVRSLKSSNPLTKRRSNLLHHLQETLEALKKRAGEVKRTAEEKVPTAGGKRDELVALALKLIAAGDVFNSLLQRENIKVALTPGSTAHSKRTAEMVQVTALTSLLDINLSINCKSGCDRTGMVAAMAQASDAMLAAHGAEALKELAVNFHELSERVRAEGPPPSLDPQQVDLEGQPISLVGVYQNMVFKALMQVGRPIVDWSTGVNGFKWDEKVGNPLVCRALPQNIKQTGDGDMITTCGAGVKSLGGLVVNSGPAKQLLIDQAGQRGA